MFLARSRPGEKLPQSAGVNLNPTRVLTKSNSVRENRHLERDITPTALKNHASGYSNIFDFAHVAPLI